MSPQTIRANRVSLDLSVEQFASMLGVASARTVRRWESGQIEAPLPVRIMLQAMREVPAFKAWMLATLD